MYPNRAEISWTTNGYLAQTAQSLDVNCISVLVEIIESLFVWKGKRTKRRWNGLASPISVAPSIRFTLGGQSLNYSLASTMNRVLAMLSGCSKLRRHSVQERQIRGIAFHCNNKFNSNITGSGACFLSRWYWWSIALLLFLQYIEQSEA